MTQHVHNSMFLFSKYAIMYMLSHGSTSHITQLQQAQARVKRGIDELPPGPKVKLQLGKQYWRLDNFAEANSKVYMALANSSFITAFDVSQDFFFSKQAFYKEACWKSLRKFKYNKTNGAHD